MRAAIAAPGPANARGLERGCYFLRWLFQALGTVIPEGRRLRH
jgi:hypothetical protein